MHFVLQKIEFVRGLSYLWCYTEIYSGIGIYFNNIYYAPIDVGGGKMSWKT